MNIGVMNGVLNCKLITQIQLVAYGATTQDNDSWLVFRVQKILFAAQQKLVLFEKFWEIKI